jgi:two-component system NarL family response regulator
MGIESIFDCEPDIEVVGSASSPQEALDKLPGLKVDILLTDLRMKSSSGDELIVATRKISPATQAIVLSNFHSDEEVFKAMRAGARAFLLKSASIEEVINVVHAVRNGESCIPPQIAQQLADRISRNQPSDRELEILRLVANGYKNREIAQSLSISENTVRNHVNNILAKLDSRDRTEAVTVAIRQGLVRLDDD